MEPSKELIVSLRQLGEFESQQPKQPHGLRGFGQALTGGITVGHDIDVKISYGRLIEPSDTPCGVFFDGRVVSLDDR